MDSGFTDILEHVQRLVSQVNDLFGSTTIVTRLMQYFFIIDIRGIVQPEHLSLPLSHFSLEGNEVKWMERTTGRWSWTSRRPDWTRTRAFIMHFHLRHPPQVQCRYVHDDIWHSPSPRLSWSADHVTGRKWIPIEGSYFKLEIANNSATYVGVVWNLIKKSAFSPVNDLSWGFRVQLNQVDPLVANVLKHVRYSCRGEKCKYHTLKTNSHATN